MLWECKTLIHNGQMSEQKIQDINVTWSRSPTGEIKVEVEAIRNLGNNTSITQTATGSQQGPACN